MYQNGDTLLFMDMNPARRDQVVAETSRAIAEQLRAERAAAGLTHDAAASRAGMNRKTVMRFETGERAPNVLQLAALCEAYGLSLGEFMERAEQRTASARERPGEDAQVSGG